MTGTPIFDELADNWNLPEDQTILPSDSVELPEVSIDAENILGIVLEE